MSSDWQTWVALCIVAAAAWILVRKLIAAGAADAGCSGGCQKCPASRPARGPERIELVQLGRQERSGS